MRWIKAICESENDFGALKIVNMNCVSRKASYKEYSSAQLMTIALLLTSGWFLEENHGVLTHATEQVRRPFLNPIKNSQPELPE